jgi:hypothetical protein
VKNVAVVEKSRPVKIEQSYQSWRVSRVEEIVVCWKRSCCEKRSCCADDSFNDGRPQKLYTTSTSLHHRGHLVVGMAKRMTVIMVVVQQGR